ncbi:hypothetical protein HDU80_002739, partial [Chytriomyces hyalinus]
MKTALLFVVAAQSLLAIVEATPVWTYFQDPDCQTGVVRAKTRQDDPNCQPFGCTQLNNKDGTFTGKYVMQICTSDPMGAARAAFSPFTEVVEEYQHNDPSCNDQFDSFALTVPNVCFAPEGGAGTHFRFSTNSNAAVLDQFSDDNCQTNLNVGIAQQFNVCYDRASSPLGGTG